MRNVLMEIFHVYVIAMMGIFFVMSTLAASGSFDIWRNRYAEKKPIPEEEIFKIL